GRRGPERGILEYGTIYGSLEDTYRRRLGLVNKIYFDTVEIGWDEGKPLARNMGSEFLCMFKEAKVLRMALEIPCLDSLGEVEAQFSFVEHRSFCMIVNEMLSPCY
ncbi:hypothetical protein MKX01_004761, partial [Papaver californicum]